MIDILNEHLADAIDLQLQAKQAHWSIKDPTSLACTSCSIEVAAQAREYADEIAERAVALGGVARGTVQAVSGQSQLREYPLEVGDWRAHVRAMQDALATFGRGARKAIDDATALNDADTADLFTEISRGVDKSLWMVEAHVRTIPADAKQLEDRRVTRIRTGESLGLAPAGGTYHGHEHERGFIPDFDGTVKLETLASIGTPSTYSMARTTSVASTRQGQRMEDSSGCNEQ